MLAAVEVVLWSVGVELCRLAHWERGRRRTRVRSFVEADLAGERSDLIKVAAVGGLVIGIVRTRLCNSGEAMKSTGLHPFGEEMGAEVMN